mgnify:FL=1
MIFTSFPTNRIHTYQVALLFILFVPFLLQSCTTESLVKEDGSSRAPVWYQPTKLAQFSATGVTGVGYAVSRDSLEALQFARETASNRLRTAVHLYTEKLRESAKDMQTTTGSPDDSPRTIPSESFSKPEFFIQLRTITDKLPLRDRTEERASYQTEDGIYHQFVLYRLPKTALLEEYRQSDINPEFLTLLESDASRGTSPN